MNKGKLGKEVSVCPLIEMQGYTSPQGYPDSLLTPPPNMDRKRSVFIPYSFSWSNVIQVEVCCLFNPSIFEPAFMLDNLYMLSKKLNFDTDAPVGLSLLKPACWFTCCLSLKLTCSPPKLVDSCLLFIHDH